MDTKEVMKWTPLGDIGEGYLEEANEREFIRIEIRGLRPNLWEVRTSGIWASQDGRECFKPSMCIYKFCQAKIHV